MGKVFRILPLLAMPFGLSFCSHEPDYCVGLRSEGHGRAMSAELKAAGISYRIAENNRLCVDGDDGVEAMRIGVRVDQYYVGAAGLIRTSQQRGSIIAEMERRGKEYSIQPTDGGDELLVIFSESEMEFRENQALLKSLD